MTDLTPPSSQQNTPSRHRSPRASYQDDMDIDPTLSDSSTAADAMSPTPTGDGDAAAGEAMDTEPLVPSPRRRHDSSAKSQKHSIPSASAPKSRAKSSKGEEQLLDSALVAKWKRVIGDVCDDSAVGKLTAELEGIKSAT